MDWSDATWWWIVTGMLVVAELGTGNFFLLMMAIGSVAAAIAAHAGVELIGQLLAAALVGGGAVALWYVRRMQHPPGPDAAADRNVNLDVGERVHVLRWEADGTSRVQYRGAAWTARYAGAGAPLPGEHVIRAIDGNRLLLERVR